MIESKTAPSGDGAGYVIVDLGKKRRKAVKRLRRGTGKLLDQVKQGVDELRTAGTISAGAQTVIVVVREKQQQRWF